MSEISKTLDRLSGVLAEAAKTVSELSSASTTTISLPSAEKLTDTVAEVMAEIACLYAGEPALEALAFTLDAKIVELMVKKSEGQ